MTSLHRYLEAHEKGLSLYVAAGEGSVTNAHLGDMATLSAMTRERLGWSPAGSGIIEDLRNVNYGVVGA